MEAKDTVTFTHSRKFEELCVKDPAAGKLVKGLLECQAELTWKLAFREGMKSACRKEIRWKLWRRSQPAL